MRTWLPWIGLVCACGGGEVTATGDDDDTPTTGTSPTGDDDDDTTTATPSAPELLVLTAPEAIDFTWESSVSECPFSLGIVSLRNDDDGVSAELQLEAPAVEGQPALLFRSGDQSNPSPNFRATVPAGQTREVEIFYGCFVETSFAVPLTVTYELPTLEGPFTLEIPVSGEILP